MRKQRKKAPSIFLLSLKSMFLVCLCLFLFWIVNITISKSEAIEAVNVVEHAKMRDAESIENMKKTKLADFLSNEKQTHETAEINQKTIYLTFDDGPTPSTAGILNVLDEHKVHATFFFLGPNMEKHINIVKRSVDEGHIIGLHGMSHDKQQFYASTDSPLQEMDTANEILQSITGLKTTLIRTPYGSVPLLKDNQKQALIEAGYSYWDWNIDSFDWKYNNAKYVDEVMSQVKLYEINYPNQPLVILMHDRPATVENLDKLLTLLKEQQYQFKALSNDLEPVTLK